MRSIRIDRHQAPEGCQLVLKATRASDSDIARGLAAAQAVFDAADVHPHACAYAADMQELDDPDLALTDEQCNWADVRRTAMYAAREAGCPNWATASAGFEWSLSNYWPTTSRHPA